MEYSFKEKGLAFKLILFIFTSVAVIFCVIFLYNYTISKKIVERNLRLNAENLTVATVLKVDKVLIAVQKIPDNFSRLIEASDFSKEELIKILQQEVANNPEIFGAALAFEPGYFNPKQKYYAPYFYRDSDKIEF